MTYGTFDIKERHGILYLAIANMSVRVSKETLGPQEYKPMPQKEYYWKWFPYQELKILIIVFLQAELSCVTLRLDR